MSPEAPAAESQMLKDVPLSNISDLAAEFDVASEQEFSLFIETISSEVRPRAALLQFEFFDGDGNQVTAENWRPISKRFGPFKYLLNKVSGEFQQERLSLVAPLNAEKLRITGHKWNDEVETQLVGRVQIQIPALGQMVQSYPSGLSVPYLSKDLNQIVRLPSDVSSVNIEVEYQSEPGVKNTTPVQVVMLDEDRNYIPGVSSLPKNVNFGSFLSLEKSSDEPKVHKSELVIPRGAVFLQFIGIDWKLQNATIFGDIKVTATEGQRFSLEKWIESVPKDATLIVIDTTAPPLGHATLSLRPNNLAAAYARLGAYVIFLPFGSLQEFDSQVAENLIQVPRNDFSLLLGQLLSKRSPRNSIFVSSSFPSINSITASKRLKSVGWTIIYEARDDMEEFKRVGYSKWYDPQLERQMLRIADDVVSVSSALDEKLVSLWPGLSKHKVIPNGVNSRVIESSANLRSHNALVERNKVDTVGYVGHLTSSWFDWELVIATAERRPRIRFEIVGHGMPEGLKLPSNVAFLGPKTHDELPSIVSNWKCGLIPFKDLPLTRSVDPNKIYEYFAWGLRCITAPMGMVHKYPSTWVYRSAEEFERALDEALQSDIDDAEIQVLEDFLNSASWDYRASEMIEVFDSAKPNEKD